MTVIDDEAVPAVLEVINEVGKTVTVKTESISYDPSTASGSPTYTTHTGQKCVVRAPTSEELANGLGEDGQSVALFAASGLAWTPSLTVRVVMDSADWTTVRVDRIAPSEQTIAWRLWLRRA